MPTVKASRPLDMAAELEGIDSDALIESLNGNIGEGTNNVFLQLGPAGGVDVQFRVSTSPTSFSIQFRRFTFHVDDEFSPVTWDFGGLGLAINGSVVLHATTADVTMSIPGFLVMDATISRYTGAFIGPITETWLSGNRSLDAHIFRLDDRVTGSSGKDNLLGYAGNDVINGNGGADRINGGAGADRVYGGAGNDTIFWGVGDKVNGAGGEDTLKLASSLNLVPLDDEIASIERFDLRGGVGSTLTLGTADVLALSMATDNIEVLGDGGDRVDVVGTFRLVSSDGEFSAYRLGRGAMLTVDSDVAVV